MKSQSKTSLLILLVLLNYYAYGFQFMKNWKLPTRNRNQEVAQDKFGDHKLVVISDASSDLGRKTAQALLNTGEYHVIGGVPSNDEMKNTIIESEHFTPMLCELDSMDSVRDFCQNIEEFRMFKPIDRLICCGSSSVSSDNTSDDDDHVQWSKDGLEQTMHKNYVSSYLMTCLLLDSMEDSIDARVTMVCANDDDNNKIKAKLGGLQGFEYGLSKPIAMANGSTKFNGPVAHANSELCQKLFTNYLHNKFHKITRVTFNNFDAYSANNSNEGLLDVVHDPKYAGQSGVSWKYDGTNPPKLSEEEDERVYDVDTAFALIQQSEKLTGAKGPKIKQITSPCPTLKVVGAITKGQVRRQELKRMRELGRPGISEPTLSNVKKTKRQRVAAAADKVVSTVLKHTVGRVARIVTSRLLGEFPEEALTGSFDNDITDEDVQEIEQEISNEIFVKDNDISNKEDPTNKFKNKKLVVLTGSSSGLGRKTALALLRSGEYHVIGAVRDLDKMEAVAEVDGFDLDNFTPMLCELNSFKSVRAFCDKVDEFREGHPIDRVICNAGVYQPSLRRAKWSKDGIEQTLQINFLSHFLMISKLMKGMEGSEDPRVTMVGSVTGNDNTVGGGGVYPIADLHDLDGMKAGSKNPIEMADGYGFIGAKAYKDSKLCLMILANFLHAKYHKQTGIAFSSMYPGCIAESPLFREKRTWFRKYFPIFMKFITGGYVGEHEAGMRLFQVAHDPRCVKSGVYWSWNGGPREGRGAEAIEKGGQISGGGGAGGGWDSIFENDQSSKVLNFDTGFKLFEYASKITNAEWPDLTYDDEEEDNEQIALDDIIIKHLNNDSNDVDAAVAEETLEGSRSSATDSEPVNQA